MTTDRGLGRHHVEDHRDRDYLLRNIAPIDETRPRTQHWPFFAAPLDQGATGTCVEHGWRHWGMCAPTISTKRLKAVPQYDLYREMVTVDEWPQNDAEGGAGWAWHALQFGTSVRAGAKVFQRRGWLQTYGWIFKVDMAILWLSHRGALVGGFDWHDGMMQTDAQGFIHPTGRIRGGHCVCLIGWSEQRGAARGINSWGVDWGEKGRFWLKGEDLERLLNADGELCSSVEIG